MDSTSINHDDGLRGDPELHTDEAQNLTQESVDMGKRKQVEEGTTNLWNHLQNCKQFKAWEDGQDPTQNQKVINKEGQLHNVKVSEPVFRDAVNEMLVIGELPLAFVESIAFRHFCNKVNLYTPHSRRTATRDIEKMFVERKAALREWFLANKQRVSLTTDICVSQVTAYYVDNHWRLKKLIIGFKYVTYHKGKTISNTLLECLAEWGIEKIFCVTVDNATANSNALTSSTLNAHKCYGEIVNIASKLQLLCCSLDDEVKVKADEMIKKFENYWDGLKNINKMLIIVSVFDPRKKMQFAKLCLEQLYGEGSSTAAGMVESILFLMRNMYDEYTERHIIVPNVVHQPQTQTQSQASSSQNQSEETQNQSQPDSQDIDEDMLDEYNPVEQKVQHTA
ncbi:hypothetical protein AALP_AA1G334800 [Arabis alpina]|uniref:hAT-like transposase RNase-H fold domain-containing protein n=1 Tax=Arabis alpina TaxID=50452 RepID=A0A087HSC6_ARAAL|nr:hypothetical protein AALP_AA1G334800 [Arabis alpina]